ncbi:MAG: HNH endonuclease [Planctomycetota bacterium]|nr:HNH endonuclease [Planctomycetota bacterium]
MVLNDATLVLNKHWVPVDFTTVLDALCKLYAGSARAIKPDDYSVHDFESWAQLKVAEGAPCVRTATIAIPVPEVIILAHYGRVPDRGLAFSRGNLFRRDRYTCQYCGRRPGTAELTIDHVSPRSRGGISSWTNCVVACLKCNSRKANRTAAEAGLVLRRQPAKPEWSPRLVVARIPCKASWEKFVSDAYWNVELKE